MYESHRTISVQLVSDMHFVWSADSQSNLFQERSVHAKMKCMNIHQMRDFLSSPSILSPGRRFNIIRILSSTFSLNEIERTGRILHSSFVSKPMPASQLSIVDVTCTNCDILSLTRFPCHGRPPCGPHSGLLMPLLRVHHSISLNEVFLLIIGTGFRRSYFELHFVIFGSEFPWA